MHFHSRKMHLKMPSGKRRPPRLGLNVLMRWNGLLTSSIHSTPCNFVFTVHGPFLYLWLLMFSSPYWWTLECIPGYFCVKIGCWFSRTLKCDARVKCSLHVVIGFVWCCWSQVSACMPLHPSDAWMITKAEMSENWMEFQEFKTSDEYLWKSY